MSKKPLLSENQIAKWMKLANIDQNATQNFLTENKKSNKRTLKENMGASYARGDEEEAPMGDEMDMGDLGDVGDGAMGDEPSVEEPMDMGADQGELEFDTNRPDGALNKLTDNSKVTSLGWKPKVDLKVGLKRAYEWYIYNCKR